MPHDSDPEIDYSIFDTGEMRQMTRDKKIAVEYNPDPWYKQEKPKAYFAAAGVIFVLYMILF